MYLFLNIITLPEINITNLTNNIDNISRINTRLIEKEFILITSHSIINSILFIYIIKYT